MILLTPKQDGDEKEYAKELSENINKRMTKTLQEMQQRHATGTNELDDPDKAPTGPAYQAVAAQRQASKQAEKAYAQTKFEEEQKILQMQQVANQLYRNNEDDDSSKSSSDDEFDYLLEEDDELEAIRARRLAKFRAEQQQTAEYKSLGHGELRTITQDEFLPECTGSSEWVVVHFFHKDFERCKIMDEHLKTVAGMHLNCKFLRLDAEKTPFFVHKLNIKTLPTVMVFQEGKAIDKLMGFQGLAVDESEPDKIHTGRLQQWLASTGCIKYKTPMEDMKEEMRRMGIRAKGTIWSGTKGTGYATKDYDSE